MASFCTLCVFVHFILRHNAMSLHSTPTDASNTELRHKYKYKNTIRAYGRRPASLDKKTMKK